MKKILAKMLNLTSKKSPLMKINGSNANVKKQLGGNYCQD